MRSFKLLLSFVLAAAPLAAQEADGARIDKRIGKLESEMRAVQRKVFPGADARFFEPEITAPEVAAPAIGNPATTPLADLADRVGELERQLRTLTGQVEAAQFKLRTMEDAQTKQRADVEFRLNALESRFAAAPAAAPATTFTPSLRPELIATIETVEVATTDGRLSIVDARLPRFYNGDGGGYPRTGHIPTAANIPFATVSENGHFKAPTELRRLFTDAGVVDGKPVVTYCHIGQQASLLWFVATMLGYDAKMFDGSFQEWSGTERLPVVAPRK